MEKIEVVQVLRRARNLLARPNGWTTGVLARDVEGSPILYTQPEATCFCLIGAEARAIFDFAITSYGDLRAVRRPLTAALIELGRGATDYVVFNDEQMTVEPVLALYDRAIAIADEAT